MPGGCVPAGGCVPVGVPVGVPGITGAPEVSVGSKINSHSKYVLPSLYTRRDGIFILLATPMMLPPKTVESLEDELEELEDPKVGVVGL